MTTEQASTVPPWAAGASERMHELDPVLTEEEIAMVDSYGSRQVFSAGELLWATGDRAPMILVLQGQIDVFRKTDEGEAIIISHGPGHYVGETITMTGSAALVSGRAATDGQGIVVQPDDIRRLIATEADLGEKLLLSFILRRMRMVAENLGYVLLIGNPEEVQAASLQSFLSRNAVPFETLDPESNSERCRARMAQHNLDHDCLPAVICNENVLIRPTNRELAECLGFTAEIDCGVTYDVAVVGSGPAGMAAAVYAASEGLSVLVLEQCAPGGQAGSSSKIENYMGFPTGISGQALMGRAYLQAQKFGAHVAIARVLHSLEPGEPWHKLRIDGNDLVFAKAVVIATGAVYRQPAIEGLSQFGGVHYGASHVEAQLCRGKEVAIIGGGNSAGQAAVYLSHKAKAVHILIRGESLASSMSDYLIQRINKLPNVTVHNYSEVQNITGEKTIESIDVINNQDQSVQVMNIAHLFIFIGAQPGTSFINQTVALDKRGFVLTGDQLSDETLNEYGWPLERRPNPLETSVPRVFAAGDVRSGSIKRVASAVGEGSVCVQYIHGVINETQ